MTVSAEAGKRCSCAGGAGAAVRALRTLAARVTVLAGVGKSRGSASGAGTRG